MKPMNDPMNSLADRSNPFRMPEGYLASFEDRLMQRIAAEESGNAQPQRRPLWRILKPALTLAAMFALIFGMGYGVLSLTHTLDRGTGTTVSDYALVEEELIRGSSVFDYFNLDQSEEEEEQELSEEDLVDYLASELSYADLAEIYAQLY